MQATGVGTGAGQDSERLTILAVADQVSPVLYDYFEPERWRNIDLIISCGDLPPYYLEFLVSSLNVPLLYVRGNHDGKYPASDYQGMENLHGRIVTCRGLRITGFEGCHRYNTGDVQYTESEMKRTVRLTRIKALRGGAADVIVSHAPPFGTHDAEDECHRGFESFQGLIKAWHPRLFVHGHMHNYIRGARETMIGTTRVVQVYPYSVLEVPVGALTASVS